MNVILESGGLASREWRGGSWPEDASISVLCKRDNVRDRHES